MKKILISGSIAYDFIMNYEGFFKDALLEKNLSHLNVSFTGVNKKRFYGGCGCNIAYNMGLFGIKPLLFGTAGKDFEEYSKWLYTNNVNLDLVGTDKNEFTASAVILTDKKENQITFFSPGAMLSETKEKKLTDKNLKDLKFAVLSPDICSRTFRLGKLFVKTRVPYFFDPGQMTPAFKTGELKFLINNAYGFIANSYEVKLLLKRLSIDKTTLREKTEIFIETLGENGSVLYLKNGKSYKIPAVKPLKVVDPTGCGDAFRGGFFAGLMNDLSPLDACKTGSLTATYKIETSGTQNHKFSLKEFRARLKKSF